MIRAFHEDDTRFGWAIWLDVDDVSIERTGLCIGTGASFLDAWADAMKYLAESSKELANLQPPKHKEDAKT